jgi:single-strand DNA-binding protein
MYLNKALIAGNLTRDPELKALPSGANVCSFGIATNRVWKDQNGEKKEATEFHNIVVFGRQAETCAQYLRKGQQALVEGRLQTRSWEKDGAKQYRTEIVADRVQFGPKAGGAGSGAGGTEASEVRGSGAPHPPKEKKEGEKKDEIDYPAENISPDDIPF